MTSLWAFILIILVIIIISTILRLFFFFLPFILIIIGIYIIKGLIDEKNGKKNERKPYTQGDVVDVEFTVKHVDEDWSCIAWR